MAYRYSGLVALIAISVIILFRDELIPLIYGNDFQKAVQIVPYFGIAIFFESLKLISVAVLNAVGYARVVTITDTFGVIFISIAGFVFIKHLCRKLSR